MNRIGACPLLLRLVASDYYARKVAGLDRELAIVRRQIADKEREIERYKAQK